MKKSKILSFLLAVAMLMSLVPSVMVSAANDSNVIWEENFDGKTLDQLGVNFEGTNEIVDGVFTAKTSNGNGNGFNFATLDAAVADAPEGKIRVKYDILTPWGQSMSKAELKTNGANVPLICYYFWEQIMHQQNSGKIGSYSDVWYTNDIVLDFDNDKLIINVTRISDGEKMVTDHEISYDLSGVTTVKGIDIYGYDQNGSKRDMLYDNFVIEYVDSTSEEPDEPEEFNPVIWEEAFDGNLAGYEVSTGAIANGEFKTTSGNGTGGFNFATLDAAVEDAPLDQVRVKFDIKANGAGGSRAKIELKTNTSNVFLIDYGQYNVLRPSDMWTEYAGQSFEANVWHTNDIILDFANNKLIINVAERDSGEVLLADYEYAYDLSGVTTIKGIDVYGWGCANDTYYDNFVIEYVEEEIDEPVIPDEPEFDPVIWEEDFSTGNTYGGENASIVDGALKAGTGSGNGGFNFATLDAAVADAPLDQVRVKFDIKANGAGGSRAKAELKTNTSNVFLIDFGQYNMLRPSDGNATYNGVSFSGNVWYTSDIVLDFANNKLIINVAERDSGNSILTDFEYAYDLSAVTTIKGIDIYGWGCANDTYYDNFVIEYVEEADEPDEPVIPDEPEFDPVIWEEAFDGNLAGYEVSTGAIANGEFKTTSGNGTGGFNFATLNAAVEDAPVGQVRVKFDIKANGSGDFPVAKAELKTNTNTVKLINYGTWNMISSSNENGTFYDVWWTSNVWYTNDIIVDFDNNKIIVNITERDSGNVVLAGYELPVDLSAVTTIKGIDIYGWGCSSDTYYDNFLIEYLEEEYVPEEPEIETLIWEEAFDGDLSGYEVSTGAIENGEFKTTSGNGTGGFNFATLNAAVEDAPEGKVRVKFDIKANGSGDHPVAKAELKTNTNTVKLVNYGAHNMISSHSENGTFYDVWWTSDVWYSNDIVVDFANNKLIVNITERESGTPVLVDYELPVDLSAVTTVKGIDIYGWGCSSDTYYDNFVIEYVISTPVVNSDRISIYTNDYEEYVAAVAPGANKIVIDFGAAIAEATLEDAIAFANVTDDEDVAFEGTLEGTKYVITFNGLLPNKTYKLTVSGDIENILGETVGAEYVLSFTTTNGNFKASFVSLKQGSTVIDDLADITAGDATVTVSYEKTTPGAKTIKVLYAYYNGNKMEDLVLHNIVIGEDELSGTKTDTVTFGTLDGITNVKVMLWEDLMNIQPLCEEIDL